MLIDRDLDFRNEEADFTTKRAVESYPLGTAVLWSPFLVVAHVHQVLGPGLANGYATAYQRAAGVGTLVYGSLGLFLMLATVRRLFGEWLSLGAVVLTCAGTFVLWYLVVESSMSHGVSMFAASLFVWQWARLRQDEDRRGWVLLGLAAGLMVMVRVAEPALRAGRPARPGEPAVEARGAPGSRGRAGGCGARGGRRLLAPARGRGRSRSPETRPPGRRAPTATSRHPASRRKGMRHPRVVEVLFASDHGLLTTTPLLYLGIGGLVPAFRRDRRLVGGLALALGAQLVLNSMVAGWGGGAGFGSRRFMGCAPVFAVGMAGSLSWLAARPRLVVGAGVGLLLVANLDFMSAVQQGRLPAGGGITYDRILDDRYERIGNPWSLPASVPFAERHTTRPVVWDRSFIQMYNRFRVDLGEEDDDLYLGTGWSHRARGPGGSFRWATGPEANVLLPIRHFRPYRLSIRCRPFVYEGSPRQSIEILVNGKALTTIELEDVLRTYEVDIPRKRLHTVPSDLRFRFAHHAAPRDVMESRDPRSLAVRFDAIELRRIR